VHLARDDEIAAQNDDGSIMAEKLASVKMPPPAYGLWRCSVVSFPLPLAPAFLKSRDGKGY
jgi:hypothetical protein